MKIEIFPSMSGDCLLVTSKDGKRLLADAGLPEAYEAYIAEPLSGLKGDIDVAYVSHIDRDHIGGILKLLDHEMKWRAFEHVKASGSRLKQPSVPRPPKIGQIWHNAFLEEIAETEKIDLGAALAGSAGLLEGLTAAAPSNGATAEAAAATRMLALSVGDAIEVNWRIGKEQLNIPLNPDFGGKLMTARAEKAIPVGTMKVKVLGPTAKELRELRKDWVKWLNKNPAQLERLRKRHRRDVESLKDSVSPTELADMSRELALSVEKDVTPPNLASLVLLIEEDGRKLLLTGDAGDVTLLDYLKAAQLLDENGGIAVDVLKVPHHGAKNSFSPGFVKAVRASHYIFCGDGEHHNPEPDVVRGYLEAVEAAPLSNGRKTTFWFNWSLAHASEFRDLWQEVESLFQGRPAHIKRRSLRKNETSMKLELR